MKIRNGFVSNSSSSSFVILKDTISESQQDMILNYCDWIDNFIKNDPNSYDPESTDKLSERFAYYNTDLWDIEEQGDYIFGETSMDNFYIGDYFDYIKIDNNLIKWEEGYNDRPYPSQLKFLNDMRCEIRKNKLIKIEKK